MISQDIKEIKDFPGYFISRDGHVFSTHGIRGETVPMHELKLREDKDGYYDVGLYRDRHRFFRRVHRLVAEAFIDNPQHFPQVNHMDGNVKNNSVDNLEWCTNQYNTQYSYRVLGRQGSATTSRKVSLTNKDTGEISYFNSEKDCAYFLHMSHEHLNKLLTGYHDINKWRKGKQYQIQYCDIEDVTTIHNVEYGESENLSSKVPNPLLRGEDIVYSPKKYRATEGIKGLRN